jgi:hypothetical protein
MFITKHLKRIFTIIVVIFISIMLGYALRMHHEESIRVINQSQAEKDLATLEEEFYSAMKKPRSFFIFNGMFEVYPAKKNDRVFFYRKTKESSSNNIQVTKNTTDKEIYNKDERSVVVSDDPSLNNLNQ